MEEQNIERRPLPTSPRQQVILDMMFDDPVTLEELGKNVHVLFIDANSFQLIIINFISLLFPMKNKSIILQVLVRIHTNYCNSLL